MPPNCKPECSISAECPQDKACVNTKCIDPCPGTCGTNARCQVVNHNPICSCASSYTGDPFVKCFAVVVVQDVPRGNPCIPSPCGPNSACRLVGDFPACSCLPNYIGRAPNCRPECTMNAECSSNLACINEKCSDPCLGSCGIDSICTVVKHNPVCQCKTGYTGDPFTSCSVIPYSKSSSFYLFQQFSYKNKQVLISKRYKIYNSPAPPRDEIEPCNPSPCGANAICKERNGAGSCSCLPEYFGDPYTGCRPECVSNTDCDKSKACKNQKCVNPCPGVCGINSECRIQNHNPVCLCLEGYTGDPSRSCRLIEIGKIIPLIFR